MFEYLTADKPVFPKGLLRSPPAVQGVYYRGPLIDLLARPTIAVVGSRRMSPYGKAVTAHLVSNLARRGIVIISGLAIGVDAEAHRAALAAGGSTIAVLPSNLVTIYPRRHHQLSEDIVARGGALVSEYGPENISIHSYNFIARNRIIAGLSDAVVIPEAAEDSGSLHTAAFALEQGKPVFAVPGSILSSLSCGTNNLIRSGSQMALSVNDIISALDIPLAETTRCDLSGTPEERIILELIASGTADGAALLDASGLSTTQFNRTLTMLELQGRIRPLGANQWGTAHP